MAPNNSFTLSIGEANYYVHPQILGTVALPPATDEEVLNGRVVKPVVVVNVDSKTSVDSVLDLLKDFTLKDDVYSEAFGSNVVVQLSAGDREKSSAGVARVFQALKASGKFRSVDAIVSTHDGHGLPPGPYFLVDQQIHQAWKLYSDELDAFALSIVPESVTDIKRFSVLDSIAPDGIWRHVAVPSRMYYQVSESQPLAGARISVKDVFHVAGVKTTLCSRAYTEMYGPQDTNADYVEKLLRLGAVIVGKTKICSFAAADEPTDQWIDFHCPINPRGDRYQSPSGSSTGAAASLAGYEWLDFSIGGDTAGSIRAPATTNGLYSLRPSFDTTSMKGAIVNSPKFDVVGFLGRELNTLHRFVSTTLDLKDGHAYPRKIIYPADFFPHSNAKHQAMVEDFIATLERFLGIERTIINIQKIWQQCPPEEAQGKSLKEYTAKSAFWPMCKDYYHQYDDYRRDYAAKYGVKPYAGAIVSYRWEIGASLSDEDYRKGNEEQAVFRHWFNDKVMTTHEDTLSDAVMVMPYGLAGPKYRDSPNE